MNVRTLSVADAMKVLTSGAVAKALKEVSKEALSEDSIKATVEYIARFDYIASSDFQLRIMESRELKQRFCDDTYQSEKQNSDDCIRDLQNSTQRTNKDHDWCNGIYTRARDEYNTCKSSITPSLEKEYAEIYLPKIGGSDDPRSISLYDLNNSDEALGLINLTAIQKHVILGALMIALAEKD